MRLVTCAMAPWPSFNQRKVACIISIVTDAADNTHKLYVQQIVERPRSYGDPSPSHERRRNSLQNVGLRLRPHAIHDVR